MVVCIHRRQNTPYTRTRTRQQRNHGKNDGTLERTMKIKEEEDSSKDVKLMSTRTSRQQQIFYRQKKKDKKDK